MPKTDIKNVLNLLRNGIYGLFLLPFFGYAQQVSTIKIQQNNDSLDQVQNKINFPKLLITGQTFNHRNLEHFISIDGLLPNIFQFNTLEGFVLGENIDWHKGFRKTAKFLSIGCSTKYGFQSHKAYLKSYVSYSLNKEKDAVLRIDGGFYTQQLNSNNPISVPNNTVTSLFWGENYLKIYERGFGNISYRQEFVRGISVQLSGMYEKRYPLQNQSLFSFRKPDSYTDNSPLATFEPHAIFAFNATLRLNLERLSSTSMNYFSNIGLQYPMFTLNYQKATPIMNSNIGYEKIILKIFQNIDNQLFGETVYELSSGVFLAKNDIALPDYFHFSGNQSAFSGSGIASFFMLDYYTHATATHFFQAHAEHHFRGLLFNKSQWLRRHNWHEILGFHTLYTPEKGLYQEWNMGIEHIFKFYRLDFILRHGASIPTGGSIRVRVHY